MFIAREKFIPRIFSSKQLLIFAILFFWYVALFPGRIGYDGSLALRMMRSGQSTDIWTSAYFLFLKITTFNGREIFIASLIGISSLAFSLYTLAKTLIHRPSTLQNSLMLLFAVPPFGVFALTVGHDVFLASGIILIVSHEIGIMQGIKVTIARKYFLTLATSIFLSVDFLGLYVLGLYLLTLVLRKDYLRFLICVSITILIYVLTNHFVVHERTPPRYLYPLAADLKCVAQQPGARLDKIDWKFLEELTTREKLINVAPCNNTDPTVDLLKKIDTGEIKVSQFLRGYTRIANHNPSLVIASHIARSEEALPAPFFPIPKSAISIDSSRSIGIATDASLINGPDFLHISIDDSRSKLNIFPLRVLESIALAYTFLFNISSWLWGWGGLWFWIVVAFLIRIPIKTKGIRKIIPLYPILAVIIALFYLGPISAPRYVMSIILIGIYFLIVELMNLYSRRKMY